MTCPSGRDPPCPIPTIPAPVSRSARRPILDDRSALRSVYLAAAHAEQAAGLAVIPLHFKRDGRRVLDIIAEDEESGVGPLFRRARPALRLEAPFRAQHEIAI